MPILRVRKVPRVVLFSPKPVTIHQPEVYWPLRESGLGSSRARDVAFLQFRLLTGIFDAYSFAPGDGPRATFLACLGRRSRPALRRPPGMGAQHGGGEYALREPGTRMQQLS